MRAEGCRMRVHANRTSFCTERKVCMSSLISRGFWLAGFPHVPRRQKKHKDPQPVERASSRSASRLRPFQQGKRDFHLRISGLDRTGGGSERVETDLDPTMDFSARAFS